MSKTLHTGGDALGAISTRSNPASYAIFRASAIETTPRFSPVWSIRRTSAALMLWFDLTVDDLLISFSLIKV